MYDYSNYPLNNGGVPPQPDLQAQVPQVDPGIDSQATGFSPVPNMKKWAPPVTPQAAHDDLFDLPAGMYSQQKMGDSTMITHLPDDGALVYGQGGGHAKYVVDPQATSGQDFRNDYNQGMRQMTYGSVGGAPGSSGPVPAMGATNGSLQPQTFNDFRQSLGLGQQSQQPNIAQQYMAQQNALRLQDEAKKHHSNLVNNLMGLGLAGVGMVGGPRMAAFAGGAAHAMQQRAEQERLSRGAAGGAGGASAAGLADLMKAQYAQDPNNPANIKTYHDMFNDEEGRNIDRSKAGEDVRWHDLQNGTTTARNAQEATHWNNQDETARYSAGNDAAAKNYAMQAQYQQAKQAAAQLAQQGHFQEAQIANMQAERMLQGQDIQERGTYHGGLLGLEGDGLKEKAREFDIGLKSKRQDYMAHRVVKNGDLVADYDYSPKTAATAQDASPQQDFLSQLGGISNGIQSVGNGAQAVSNYLNSQAAQSNGAPRTYTTKSGKVVTPEQIQALISGSNR